MTRHATKTIYLTISADALSPSLLVLPSLSCFSLHVARTPPSSMSAGEEPLFRGKLRKRQAPTTKSIHPARLGGRGVLTSSKASSTRSIALPGPRGHVASGGDVIRVDKECE